MTTLTVEDLAALLHINRQTVVRLVRRQSPRIPQPLPKVGRSAIWSQVVVDEWLARNGHVHRPLLRRSA